MAYEREGVRICHFLAASGDSLPRETLDNLNLTCVNSEYRRLTSSELPCSQNGVGQCRQT